MGPRPVRRGRKRGTMSSTERRVMERPAPEQKPTTAATAQAVAHRDEGIDKDYVESEAYSLVADQVNAWYGQTHAIKDVSMTFRANEVTALIGPSGCGKSTFLRCLNRMHEVLPG